MIHAGLVGYPQLEPDGDRVLGVLILQVTDVFTVQQGGYGGYHGVLAQAQTCRPGTVDLDDPAHCRILHTVINVDNIRGLLEHLLDPVGNVNLSRIVQPVVSATSGDNTGGPGGTSTNLTTAPKRSPMAASGAPIASAMSWLLR